RYRTLAPWCLWRRGILLSATPVVNRFDDVVHQLLLFIRNDALAWAGGPMRHGFQTNRWAGPLARLVITGEDRSALLPRKGCRDLRIEEPSGSPQEILQQGIQALRLSSDPGTAGLIRVSLLAALTSSPLAVAAALGRYRALLLHGRDAAASGRVLSRQVIRRFVGVEWDQLVFWPLLPEGGALPDLAIEDLAAVRGLESLAREWGTTADAKAAALAQATADRKPTLVFMTALETVRYLRRHLGRRGIAWCTGAGSGVDHLALPRDDVLDWFRKPVAPNGGLLPRPVLLLATDVAAEGLDLPLVERVTHYDLPWTTVRLDQRSGRAFRLGGRQEKVEVLRFLPPKVLEAALRREAILDAKSELPERLGLGERADAPWKLRAGIAARWEEELEASGGGIALVRGASSPALVAGLRIEFSDGRAEESVLARIRAGWTDDGAVIAPLLELARNAAPCAPEPAMVRSAVCGIAAVARSLLRTAQGAWLAAPASPAPVRRARRHLLALARDAARRRDHAQLGMLERGIRFLRRGHTAGERALAEEWGTASGPDLLGRLARCPEDAPLPGVERIGLIGLLLITPKQ
ncbi:MAG TPA: C-terminal helicase domain-containing protein, partial [Gemmatimonadales bacterium]|nr:C-terminal helicase domain-containing protein [Gemmatimonadales bacterium]